MSLSCSVRYCFFFFFNVPAPTELYTLSLHDALPILVIGETLDMVIERVDPGRGEDPHLAHAATHHLAQSIDRKSTRLNSSHRCISYAVFCLKKKKINDIYTTPIHTPSNCTIHKHKTT